MGREGVTYGRCSAVWGVITVGWLPGRPAGQSPYGPAPGGAVIAAGPSPLHGQHSKQNGSKSSHSDPPALTLEINCLHHVHETTLSNREIHVSKSTRPISDLLLLTD